MEKMSYKDFELMLNCMMKLSAVMSGTAIMIDRAVKLSDKLSVEMESLTAHARVVMHLVGDVVDEVIDNELIKEELRNGLSEKKKK